MASSGLSPRAWSPNSLCSPTFSSHRQKAMSSFVLTQGETERYLSSDRLDDLQPTKSRSLRTSPKRAYHRASRPSPSLYNSFQPFLHLDHDPHLLPPHQCLDLKLPTLRTVRFPDFTFLIDSQPFWLALYFVFNLGLTLYNKGVLISFPYPYTLTALHALSGTIGGCLMLGGGIFEAARLSATEWVVLAAFSVLYAVNIAVSNVSLQLVTVPFHQIVRAATPIFTIALSACLYGQRCSSEKLLTLIPVIAGVGLATYGDYYFTYWGFLLTIAGTFLAALKTILTHVLQSSASPRPSSSFSLSGIITEKRRSRLIPPLHPLDLLIRMSPLAFVQCIFYAHLSGELKDIFASSPTQGRAVALACNGAIAFGLNVVSFTANKRVGPLSMTVAANVKQALTILFAVTIFNLTITGTNALGILLTLMGGTWYAFVDYREKRAERAVALPNGS